MADPAQIQSKTAELTTESFKTFAEDIATMFDTKVHAQQVDVDCGEVTSIKNNYKKLAAVCSVSSRGAMEGEFHVIFDKGGLFTLAGTFVMQPEQIIAQNRKNGTEEEAAEIADALAEVGNLLVGSWDRVFREEMEEHKHFVQSGTFVGDPWKNLEESLRLGKDEEVDIMTFEITVEPLDPFRCSALYPTKIFTGEQNQVIETETEGTETEEAQSAEEAPQEPSEEQAVADEEPQEEPSVQSAEDTADQTQPAEPESKPEPPKGKKQPEQQPGPVTEAIRRMSEAPEKYSGRPFDGNYLLNQLCAGDIMRSDLVWASTEETVEELVAKMQRYDSGYILIGRQKENKIEGIVSKSDVRGALSPYLQSMFVKWRSPMDIATLQIKAKWAMNRPVRTVRPDTTLAQVMHAMSEHGGRCMPVVDKEGTVHGIVTVFDIFHAILSGGIDVTTAGRAVQAPPLV